MAGGQQIASAAGTLIAEGGDGVVAVTGDEATLEAGTPGLNRLVLLRSRKVGGGTASAVLIGQASVVGQGFTVFGQTEALVGQVAQGATGTLLYRGRVTIGWTASPEPDVAGYRVYHGTTSGVYTEFQDVGNVLTYQWNGLLPGFTHYFVVTAYDTSNNESANSAEVQKTF